MSVRAEDPRRTTQLSADACAEQPRNSSEKVKYAMKHEMKLIVWIGIFATAALGKHTCTESNITGRSIRILKIAF